MINFPVRRKANLLALASTAALALSVAACSKPAEETQSPQSGPSIAAPVITSAPAPSSVGQAPAAPSGNVADADWAELVRATRQPAIPEGWANENAPTDEELEAYRASTIEQARLAIALAREFYTKYPDNRNAGSARGIEENMLRNLASLGDAEAAERLALIHQQLASDPSIPEMDRPRLRYDSISKELLNLQSGTAAFADLYHKRVLELKNDFPELEAVNDILLNVLDQNYYAQRHQNSIELVALLESLSDKQIAEKPEDYMSYRLNIATARSAAHFGDFDTVKRILDKLEKANIPVEVQQMIADTKKLEEKEKVKYGLVGKPLDLKFTALDGSGLDLENLKGKVVLIDFWATWCQPCVIAIPKLKVTYDKLHNQGLEIIGISLDDYVKKPELEKFMKGVGMDWPQYYDGLGLQNKIAVQFGVSVPPEMWLVDKSGVLRDIRRTNLESKIAKIEALLAE